MKTIPEIIEMCLQFAAIEIARYDMAYFIESCTRISPRQSRKHVKRIIWCFISADMIYEGEY